MRDTERPTDDALHKAWTDLSTGTKPERDRAAKVIYAELRALARRVPSPIREDVVQIAIGGVLTASRNGRIDPVKFVASENVRAYLSTVLQNAERREGSRLRRSQATLQRGVDDRPREDTPRGGVFQRPDLLAEHAMRSLADKTRAVAGYVASGRRKDRAATILSTADDVLDLVSGRVTRPQVYERERERMGGQLARARSRVYAQHSRGRAEINAYLDARVADPTAPLAPGEPPLSAEDIALLRRLLNASRDDEKAKEVTP